MTLPTFEQNWEGIAVQRVVLVLETLSVDIHSTE